jgi:TPP-dependent indolepyruvate ferredoxin oxidoreductase alpha subunit
MSVLTIRKPGRKVLATDTETFAREDFEAGIGFLRYYPGTPASGVGDSIAEVQAARRERSAQKQVLGAKIRRHNILV